ncbi:MAG: Imidazolonepropionase [Anaerolineales bacterium]|nr:Imidazolonepropionase [Anaerolineales bacterium]
MKVDLLIHSASQLLTCAAPEGPLSGANQGAIGLIEDGAIAIDAGRITHVGPTTDVRPTVDARVEMDASGYAVLPGFVDAHTHAVFAGHRADEFEQRVAGATYQDIMAAGGGIMSTVRATRQAKLRELVMQSHKRLNAMLTHGTTTAEVKSGYGLTLETELKMLAAISALNTDHPVELIPTFLGAHAIPDEYRDRADDFIDEVVDEMLPRVAVADALLPPFADIEASGYQPVAVFVDVFCDVGAFNLEQSRRVLERAQELGLEIKIHTDEFESLGGAALAAELGAVSADHLAVTPREEIERMAEAGVVGVLLPGTTFGLGSDHYADARTMVEVGLPVALGTDLNPGPCWCVSMPFMITLATRYMKMTLAEAVVAATINAAYASGVGDEVGSLETGKAGDLVVLEWSDYRHLAYRFGENPVATVIKEGTIHEVLDGVA